MLADRIYDIDRIGRVYLDLHRVHRVASEQRVAEDRISAVCQSVPENAFGLTAAQSNHFVHRNLNGQVEGIEFRYIAQIVKERIRVQTGRVERIAAYFSYTDVVRPYIRRIQRTDRYAVTMLGDYPQFGVRLTSRQFVDRVFGVSLCLKSRNRISVPEDSVTFVHNDRLMAPQSRHCHDLVVNDTVATFHRWTHMLYRITVDAVLGHRIAVVRLAVRQRFLHAVAQVQLHGAVRTLLHVQIQSPELGDSTFCIAYRIGPQLGGVVFLVAPDIRGINDTDSIFLAHFLDHPQVVETVATAWRSAFFRIRVGTAAGNGLTVPSDGLIHMQDLRFGLCQHSRLTDLVVNDTVATRHIRIRVGNRVAVDAVSLQVEIGLAVRQSHFVSVTEGDLLYMLDLRHHVQFQPVRAVSAGYGAGVGVGDQRCLTRRTAQRVARMVCRTSYPIIRQVCLAYSYGVFVVEQRINLQIQIIRVVTAAFCRNGVLIRTVSDHLNGRIRGRTPFVRQLVRRDTYGITPVQRFVEVQIGLYDTVATVDRVEYGNDRIVLIVILAVVTDSGFVFTGV